MVRKYLDRKDKTDIENIDPLDATERTIVFKKRGTQSIKTQSEISKNQIDKAQQYMQYINSQLADRLLRIEKIKQSHENFEKEIGLLQTEKNKQFKVSEIQAELLDEPESIKATRELSVLIQKYAVEKLDMMKKLFDSEKQQSTELYKKLQENLTKITISEERLKQQREHLEIKLTN